MASLTVWKINSADGAERAVEKLSQLQSQELIKVQDAAIVEWEDCKRKAKTRQLQNLTGAVAMGGAFWAFLFSPILFVPLLGMAIGDSIGTLTGSLADEDIDDSFIDAVRDKVTPARPRSS